MSTPPQTGVKLSGEKALDATIELVQIIKNNGLIYSIGDISYNGYDEILCVTPKRNLNTSQLNELAKYLGEISAQHQLKIE